MNINLEKYTVRSDGEQFILTEKRVTGEKAKEPGVEKDSNARYFGTLDGLVQHLLKLEIAKSESATLKDILETTKAFNTEIKQFIGGWK